jgi:hypothetical protein
MDLFTIGRPREEALQTAALPEAASSERYLPYTEAWKEFDRLQKAARGRGALSVAITIGDLAVGSMGILGIAHDRKAGFLMIGVWFAIRFLQMLTAAQQRKRFLHWPCPRCHAEWPGTKTEKDPRCRACGLRLHQLAP